MPIRLDALPVPDPHIVTLTGNVLISLPMHSTGSGNTLTIIKYSIDPANDVFIELAGVLVKQTALGPSPVLVPPGVVNDDILTLARGAGTSVTIVPIALQIQECTATGTFIGVSQHRNVMVQVK